MPDDRLWPVYRFNSGRKLRLAKEGFLLLKIWIRFAFCNTSP